MSVPTDADILYMGYRESCDPNGEICAVVLEEGHGSTYAIRNRVAGESGAESSVVLYLDDIPKLIAILRAIEAWWTARKAAGLGDDER